MMKFKSAFKSTFGWFLIGVFCLIPVVLLLKNSPTLINYVNATHALGQIFALMGMTLFALTFILSSRFKFLEELFGGLDKVYKVHSITGAVSFMLLLFHPILLVLKFIPQNFSLAATYLLWGGFWSVDFGIIALLGMIILLIITFYVKIKYHYWKFSHEFMGIFFIFAILHIFLIRGNGSRDNIFPGYYYYVAIVSIIGLIGFFYTLVRKTIMSLRYKVESVKRLNDNYDFILSPIGKSMRYNAGQFAFLKFKNKKISSESHPFSIASGSDDTKLRFVIKSLGDFTSTLDGVKAGDEVLVEGPYGKFNRQSKKSQVWIAGGIGITPFLGMAFDMKNSNIKVDMYYTVKSSSEFISIDELSGVQKSNHNFKLIKWVSDEKGFLTVDEIKRQSRDLLSKEFYICGPGGMKAALKSGLLMADVSENNIIEEDFNFK
jgi:predicted ferric reductase